MQENNIFTSEFIYPAIVAFLASIFSFLATLLISYLSDRKQKNDQRETLIDNFIMQFTKLVSVFDSLNADIESKNYYAITNTRRAQKVINSLNGYVWNIYLFKDSQLRQQIVEVIDDAGELVNEIDSMENYPYSELDKASPKKDRINQEFRAMKIKLLDLGIVLDDKLQSQYITTEVKNKDDSVKKSADDVINGLAQELQSVNSKIQNIADNNEKRRPLLATKLVDQKTRIRNLILSLKNLKQ